MAEETVLSAGGVAAAELSEALTVLGKSNQISNSQITAGNTATCDSALVDSRENIAVDGNGAFPELRHLHREQPASCDSLNTI